MDTQTWASIATMIATGIAIVTYLGRKTDLVRVEAKADNAELARRIDLARAEAKADNAELARRIELTREEAKADNADLARRIDLTHAEAKADHAETREQLGERSHDLRDHLSERIGRVESDVSEVRADVRMLADRLFNVVLAPSTRVLPSAQGE